MGIDTRVNSICYLGVIVLMAMQLSCCRRGEPGAISEIKSNEEKREQELKRNRPAGFGALRRVSGQGIVFTAKVTVSVQANKASVTENVVQPGGKLETKRFERPLTDSEIKDLDIAVSSMLSKDLTPPIGLGVTDGRSRYLTLNFEKGEDLIIELLGEYRENEGSRDKREAHAAIEHVWQMLSQIHKRTIDEGTSLPTNQP